MLENHQNNVGLQDAYLKLIYKSKQWQFTLTPHIFNAPNKVLGPARQTNG